MTLSERGYITGENDMMGFKIFNLRLILVAADPDKAWVFGRSLAGIEGSNSARGMDVSS